jgi:hypothetical protein
MQNKQINNLLCKVFNYHRVALVTITIIDNISFICIDGQIYLVLLSMVSEYQGYHKPRSVVICGDVEYVGSWRVLTQTPIPFQVVQYSRIFSSFHARKVFISWVNAVLVLINFQLFRDRVRQCRCRLSPVLGAGNGTACRRRAREAAQRRRGAYGRTCHARGSASVHARSTPSTSGHMV